MKPEWWKRYGKSARTTLAKYYRESSLKVFGRVLTGREVEEELCRRWTLKHYGRSLTLKEHEEELCREWYVKHFSECAFWYELHARREFGWNAKTPQVRYAIGVPFCKLTFRQIENVASQWKQKIAKDGGTLADERPAAYTLSLPEQIREEWLIQSLHEKAKSGWSEPGLIAFNLKECSNREILDRLRDMLKIQRQLRGIPEPKRSTGKKRRMEKNGKSFTEIEALDVFTRLPRAEAEKLRDNPYFTSDSRRAKRRIQREFPEI